MRRVRRLATALAIAVAATWPAMAPAQVTATGSAADPASRLRAADAAYDAGDRDRAEREYTAVLALDPGQSRAVYRLAQLRERRDPDAAVALYRRYVALEPDDAWGHLALARILARVGRTDASIAAYEHFVAEVPRDADAWRELAVQRRRAGQFGAALTALERVRALATPAGDRRAVDSEVARVRRAMRATIEPLTGGSRDSDGLSTVRVGASVFGPSAGAARLFGSVVAKRAGDGAVVRASHGATAGVQLRPAAQLRLEVAGGFTRADRAFIDTLAVAPSEPRAPGPGPRRPIGRVPAQGGSSFATVPTGHARLTWRKPGDAILVDARAGRQLLDASPFLVAQGVLRDEAGATIDVRLAGPLRARGFGRVASIHNEDEGNTRHLMGGALAYAPGSYEVSARAQTIRYDRATRLAYFAPRQVQLAELTTYVERELQSGATFALDLGGGAQQVADWTGAAGEWSPALRGWLQFVAPLGDALSIGTEVEAYDSRIGMDTPSLTQPGSHWRYAAANVWLRVAF